MKVSEIASVVFKRSIELKVNIKKHSSGGVSLNGTPFNPSNFKINEFFNILPITEELHTLFPNFPLLLIAGSSDFLSCLRHEMDKYAEVQKKRTLEEADDLELDLGFPQEVSKLKDLEIIMEPKSRGSLYAYSCKLNQVLEISRTTLDSQITFLPKEIKPIVLSRVKIASHVYHPSLPSGIFKVSKDIEVNYGITTSSALNSYRAPAWRTVEGKARLHPTLEKLFKFVFVGNDCLDHVYRWNHSLLFDSVRPVPIMVVHSTGGIGKGRVFEAVLGSMVGGENFQKPPRNQCGRFDAYLTSCHLYYASEALLTPSIASRYKDLFDGFTATERKGQDVTKPQRIAARFVLSSNNASDLYMNYDSRKFTVPDVRKSELLKDHMTEEELVFIESFKHDVQEQANFAMWIKYNYEPLKYEEVWHGEDFKYLCEYHLEGWFKTFRTMLERTEVFTHDELRDNLTGKSKNLSAGKLSEVLREYQAATKSKICEVLPSPDGLDVGVIYKSKIFKPEGGV